MEQKEVEVVFSVEQANHTFGVSSLLSTKNFRHLIREKKQFKDITLTKIRVPL